MELTFEKVHEDGRVSERWANPSDASFVVDRTFLHLIWKDPPTTLSWLFAVTSLEISLPSLYEEVRLFSSLYLAECVFFLVYNVSCGVDLTLLYCFQL